MRGRVKLVNDEREFGFIIGEDGNEYFFHFSNVISVDFPTKNSIVEFDSYPTEKGCSAKNIKVQELAVKKPEIVCFGNISIRLDSIKMYAIYSGYYKEEGIFTKSGSYVGTKYIDKIHLKIETFQKDVYRFFKDEVNFDIYEKKAELDRYLTM